VINNKFTGLYGRDDKLSIDFDNKRHDFAALQVRNKQNLQRH